MSVLEANSVETLYDFAGELLGLCEDALATTIGGTPERSYVSAGIPALDCCPQLSVDIRGLGEDITSPTAPANVLGHRSVYGSMIIATLVVTIARCAPMSKEGGQPPDIADLQATAQETSQDVWAIWNHLRAAILDGSMFGGRCKAVYFDQGVPLTTEGGCAGWTFQVRPQIDGYPVGS